MGCVIYYLYGEAIPALMAEAKLKGGGAAQALNEVLIDAFPEHESLKFCVAIMFSEYVVCRLDFDLEVVHGNNHSHELPLLVVGPHWHSWELNRTTIELGHRFHLPNALEFHEARQFDATLRWYCAQRHIALGAHKIELPHAERLL